MYQLHITQGNKKIDHTFNISLPPISVCANLPCYKICYARAAYDMYPDVKKAWGNNLDFFLNDPKNYFRAIIIFILSESQPVRFFRWHVGGEIVNDTYFEGMKQVALACPKTRFMVFSKRYHLHSQTWPKNLQVNFSSHPDMEMPQEVIDNHPIAWMNDGLEPRIETVGKKPFLCLGHCADCRKCWNLTRLKRDVIFNVHGARASKKHLKPIKKRKVAVHA